MGLSGEWMGRPILLKGPSPLQGLYSVFRSSVLNGGTYRLAMRPEPVASSIVQAVATEDNAIGFASHFLAAARTKTLAIAENDAGPYVLPTAEHSGDGSYPLARKLFIYVNRAPGMALSPLTASSCATSAQPKGRRSPRMVEIFRSMRIWHGGNVP
jgi:phosphate transport system substrate-binding protein